MAGPEAHRFELQLLKWSEVHELPGDWSPPQLRAVLEKLEIEGVVDAELDEMVLMGLQEREVDEAADIVLQVVFDQTMRAGVRQNLIGDLQDDRPWEDFGDLSQQRGIFTAVSLLQRAHPSRFGKPDVARVALLVQPETAQGQHWLSNEIEPSLMLRLLNAGMHERAVLRRLFAAALLGDSFPEAPFILWSLERRTPPESFPAELIVHSSIQWLAPLQEVESWEAEAWPDDAPKSAP